MNINASSIGEFIFLFIIISVIITTSFSYYLGKRKTQTPKIVTSIGFLLSFLQPFGLVFIAFLALKNDIDTNDEKEF